MAGSVGGEFEWRSFVSVLLNHDGRLYVAGRFGLVGNVHASSVAAWDGKTWTTLGGGLDMVRPSIDHVATMAVYDGDIYAGGLFWAKNDHSMINIARWDGTSWWSVGGGVGDILASVVLSMAVHEGSLYVGGQFDHVGQSVPWITASSLARWNGVSWSAVGHGRGGVDGWVTSLHSVGNELYVGGMFTLAGIGSQRVGANGIARWNGLRWSALGTGLTPARLHEPAANALAYDDVSGHLYVGGWFAVAGDAPSNRLAAYGLPRDHLFANGFHH